MDRKIWDNLPRWIQEAWLDAAERCREADKRAAPAFAQQWAEWYKDEAEEDVTQ